MFLCRRNNIGLGYGVKDDMLRGDRASFKFFSRRVVGGSMKMTRKIACRLNLKQPGRLIMFGVYVRTETSSRQRKETQAAPIAKAKLWVAGRV